jgi:ketosteroid isomerase-like protein
MRFTSRTLLILVISMTIWTTGTASRAADATADEASVAATEAAINKAIEQKDLAALDRLRADDYTFVNPYGQQQTKADRLRLLQSGELKVEAISYDQIATRIYGDTAVVVARSTVHGSRVQDDISSQRRVTSVFVRRNGHWQVVAQQSTIIVSKR